MSDSQLKCNYYSHNEEEIIAVCVSRYCQQPMLCCFTCMKEGHHQQHSNQILKFQQYNEWKQEGIKIIDQIQLVISDQENMTQLLKQLVIDNQRNIDLNIEFATASQIESSVNQINKLKLIEQIIKNDLDQLSQIMKKKIKGLKSLLGLPQIEQQSVQTQIQIQENAIQQQEIIPTAIQNIKIRFSEKDKGGLLAKLTSRSCLCEPVLPKNVESTFAIKYISGNVYIGICKRDIIRNANYQPYLQNVGHGSYLISNSGNTYSDHQKEMNFKKQSFQFSDNDIIIVNVDITNQKITWINQQTKETFSMQLDQQESDYYPLVYISIGKAEIIENFSLS